jgi:hypothetical protein
MTHRLFGRDGLSLNPCQKLRNEPKASNPGVPHATKAELIGLRQLDRERFFDFAYQRT